MPTPATPEQIAARQREAAIIAGGYTYTAETDIIVNAYGTGNGLNNTLIGSSGGSQVASCSTGNLGGTPQFSICFPVKYNASWSVTGTASGITVWVTPLS